MTTDAIGNLILYLTGSGTRPCGKNTGLPMAVVLKRLLGVPLDEAAAMCRAHAVSPETRIPRRIKLEE